MAAGEALVEVERLRGALDKWQFKLIEGGTTLTVTHKPTASGCVVREYNDQIAEDILWMLGVQLAALQEQNDE